MITLIDKKLTALFYEGGLNYLPAITCLVL